MARGWIRSLGSAALLTAALVVLPAAAQAAPPSQSPTRAVCPGTFQVLHDDRIDGLRLAAGAYQITVANPARLTCAKASQDLTEFLQDYDGKIRAPWTINTAQSTFQRGTDAAIAFQIARTAAPSGGGGGNGPSPNPTANSCPGFFRVQHNDHVGTLAFPQGAYRITLLNPKTLTCAAATRQFSGFLQDFDGKLVKPWLLNTTTGTFTRGKGSTTGFRVKQATGTEPKKGSGGRYPAKGQPGECPGTFRVLHRDLINKLAIPAGPYLTFVVKGSGLNCSQLSMLFRQFLARSDTPRGYGLTAATGTFTNRGTPIFRVKPASPRVTTRPR